MQTAKTDTLKLAAAIAAALVAACVAAACEDDSAPQSRVLPGEISLLDQDLPPLLSDPPPPAPVQEAGGSYAHGTFNSELAPLWERATQGWTTEGKLEREYLDSVSLRLRTGSAIGRYLTVRNQLIFAFPTQPSNPAATIEAELRDAGVEFNSIEVLTSADYDQHPDAAFINFLQRNDRFDLHAALRRAGLNVDTDWDHVSELVQFRFANGLPTYIPGGFRYQVKINSDSDLLWNHWNDRPTPNGWPVWLILNDFPEPNCTFDYQVVQLLAGGVYTTFGDDLLWYWDMPDRFSAVAEFSASDAPNAGAAASADQLLNAASRCPVDDG